MSLLDLLPGASDACEIIASIRNRDGWLEKKRTGFGSSDGPSLLNCGHESPMAVYTSKVLGPKDERPDQKMMVGRLIQPTIAMLVELAIGGKAQEFEMLVRSRSIPWILATPDYILNHPTLGWVLLELKNTTDSSTCRDKLRPCRMHWVQCQHQLAASGQRVMILAVFLFGYDLRLYEVRRDDAWLEGEYLPMLQRSWECVRARRLPEADDSESCRKALVRLFPDPDPEVVLQCDDIDDQPYVIAVEEIDRLQRACDKFKNQLRTRLVEAKAGTALLPDGTRWVLTKTKKGQSMKRWPVNGATEPQEESEA